MTAVAENSLLNETVSPADQPAMIAAVKDAADSRTAVYPIGGGTSLEYGLPAKRPGIGLSLASLNRVVDYPARDMTITVEAGITMKQLADTLAAERQWLPIDASQPEQATLGGVVATAFCGPRRYGWGTVRDYVIGISAVDGRGLPFKGGGRVVKNVAGYDFCKLLTGSLGTLGVITQVTLKIKPLPQRSALVVCGVSDLAMAEKLLAALVNTQTAPAAIELVAGPAWKKEDPALTEMPANKDYILAVGLEGSAPEVDWMVAQLTSELAALGVAGSVTIADDRATQWWNRLREFPAGAEAPLVIKASLRPSGICEFIKLVRHIDPAASIQAHAGNGIVIVRFADFSSAAVSRSLIGRIQPAAAAAGGHVVVLSSSGLGDMTRQALWGGVEAATEWMTKVKQQFDPHDILNPGRFIYTSA